MNRRHTYMGLRPVGVPKKLPPERCVCPEFPLPWRPGYLGGMDDLAELSTFAGIPAASFAEGVYNRYAQRLMAVAQQRLGARLRSKVSAEDVVQSAFKSFFRRREDFHFVDDGADGLWGLLVVITVRKCAKWADIYSAGKRSTAREVSLNAGASGIAGSDIAGREPTPEEAAILSELVEQLMGRFDQRQQHMICLRMQGFDVQEIANQTQSSRRTVARVIGEAKTVVRELLAQEDSVRP